MSSKYEHDLIDGGGNVYPFSLDVSAGGATGEMAWPQEISKLVNVRRTSATSVTALVVWTTMKIRCAIRAQAADEGTKLEIVFAMTPYRYRLEDEGAFVHFLGGLNLPQAPSSEPDLGEQRAPAGMERTRAAPPQLSSGTCDGKVRVEDRGNSEYAFYFLVNDADQPAEATILERWIYQGAEETHTDHHVLYPGQAKEVFSFPRNQKPTCQVTHCRLV